CAGRTRPPRGRRRRSRAASWPASPARRALPSRCGSAARGARGRGSRSSAARGRRGRSWRRAYSWAIATVEAVDSPLLVAALVAIRLPPLFPAWLARAGRARSPPWSAGGPRVGGGGREARALARLVPDCLVLARGLLGDREVPGRCKLALAGLVLYLASPIDLVPDFLPVGGVT